MIEVSNIIKIFPNSHAPVLKSVSLRIDEGDFISIVGKSGSGKSTLLYILSTLDSPSEGKVFYDLKEVTSMKPPEIWQLRNREIGFVFQFHYLLAELSALENILLPARKAKEYEKRKKFASELMKIVGLEGKEQRFPGELSGGEQQRVAIARALVMEPRYIFADEPTGNLDSENGEIVMGLLKKFNDDKGTAVIYVTHDLEFASRAPKKIHLVDGKIV
jgi:ABC-type lipoprotein export system ATPase subunit